PITTSAVSTGEAMYLPLAITRSNSPARCADRSSWFRERAARRSSVARKPPDPAPARVAAHRRKRVLLHPHEEAKPRVLLQRVKVAWLPGTRRAVVWVRPAG